MEISRERIIQLKVDFSSKKVTNLIKFVTKKKVTRGSGRFLGVEVHSAPRPSERSPAAASPARGSEARPSTAQQPLSMVLCSVTRLEDGRCQENDPGCETREIFQEM